MNENEAKKVIYLRFLIKDLKYKNIRLALWSSNDHRFHILDNTNQNL